MWDLFWMPTWFKYKYHVLLYYTFIWSSCPANMGRLCNMCFLYSQHVWFQCWIHMGHIRFNIINIFDTLLGQILNYNVGLIWDSSRPHKIHIYIYICSLWIVYLMRIHGLYRTNTCSHIVHLFDPRVCTILSVTYGLNMGAWICFNCVLYNTFPLKCISLIENGLNSCRPWLFAERMQCACMRRHAYCVCIGDTRLIHLGINMPSCCNPRCF